METAKACGLPEKAIRQMMVELADTALEKIIDTLGAMPKDFPGDLMESIAQGAASRLERIGLMLKADASAYEAASKNFGISRTAAKSVSLRSEAVATYSVHGSAFDRPSFLCRHLIPVAIATACGPDLAQDGAP